LLGNCAAPTGGGSNSEAARKPHSAGIRRIPRIFTVWLSYPRYLLQAALSRYHGRAWLVHVPPSRPLCSPPH
jgi:hypothetical protein